MFNIPIDTYNLQEMNRTVETRAAVCDHNLRDIVLPSSDLGLRSQKRLEKCNLKPTATIE